MDNKRILPQKPPSVQSLLIPIIFVLLGMWQIYDGYQHNDSIRLIIGLCGFLFFGASLVSWLRQLFDSDSIRKNR